MRQIKFRAWDKKKCKMVYNRKALYFLYHDYNMYCSEEYEPYIIEQFTGLKDKNGKDIYEGDLLSDDFGKMEVFWDNGSFLVKHIEDGGHLCGDDLCCHIADNEIIGNIHEGKNNEN